MTRRKDIFILLVFLVFCVLVYIYLKQIQHPCFKELKYQDYISTISSLASFFVALVFILEYCHIQKSDKELRKYTFADDGRDYWHQMETRFYDHPELYRLYSEINSNHPELMTSLEKNDFQPIKEAQTVSLLLAQIENLFLLHGGLEAIKNEKLSYRQEEQIQVWKRFFKSKIVLHHYQFLKENLGQDTREFIQKYLL